MKTTEIMAICITAAVALAIMANCEKSVEHEATVQTLGGSTNRIEHSLMHDLARP